MSQLNHLAHLVHHCTHAKGDDAKWAGGVLIVVGLFLTPFLIGVPLLIYGIVKLVEGFKS
jgi:hypothetical protein